MRALLVLLAKMHRADDLKYVVTLLEGALEHDAAVDAAAALAGTRIDSAPPLPLGPLSALLSRQSGDAYLVRHAGQCAARLLTRLAPDVVDKGDAERCVQALVGCLSGPDRCVTPALVNLRAVLGCARLRGVVLDCDPLPAVTALVALPPEGTPLRAIQLQLLYDALYVVWLLSFDARARAALGKEAALLGHVCAILRRVKKEKVVRMAAAIARALSGDKAVCDLLLACECHKSVALLLAKNKQEWGDEDLQDDLDALQAALAEHVDELSSFDRYTLELQSGSLQWSPVHRSERFWQQNALRFEEQDSHWLRALRALLASADPRTQAVAAWDLGEFSRFHPRGRHLVAALELKLPVMKLLQHSDEDVRKEALLALQKMLITNWEYVSQK